jgi:hypothetical protein
MEIISTDQTSTSEPSQFYRFQVFQGKRDETGRVQREKTVGMAYLKTGQSTYTLRLWTFLNERFYLLQGKNDPARYLVMSREQNRNPAGRRRYFWNIVGNACVDSRSGHMQINFDLLPGPIYMSIFPESSATSGALPEPEVFDEAA